MNADLLLKILQETPIDCEDLCNKAMLLQHLVCDSHIILLIIINYVTLKFAFLFGKKSIFWIISLDFSECQLYLSTVYYVTTQFHRDPICGKFTASACLHSSLGFCVFIIHCPTLECKRLNDEEKI